MNELQPDGLDLSRFLQILRRRILFLIAVVVLTCGVAYAIAATQPKQYTATASLLLTDPAVDQALVGDGGSAQSADPQRQAQTNLDVALLQSIAARTANRLGNGTTAEAVSSRVRVDGNPDSNVLSVDGTAKTPEEAAATANGFADEYIAFTRDAAIAKIRRAQALLQRQIADLRRRGDRPALRRSLRQRADDLGVRASLQTGNGQILQSAAPPDSPSSPKPRRNLLIGGFAGLLLGVGVALAMEQLDRRLRRAEDLEECFELPLLGRVPRSKAISHHRTPLGELPPGDAEAFRMIRANLRYYTVGRNVRSFLITSAAGDEGKTTVALYLAAAAAESGSAVLLVEADMHRASLGTALGADHGEGLTSVLMGDAQLSEAIINVPVAPGINGRHAHVAFDVLLAGPSPPNPSQLLESVAMEHLLREAKAGYDLVIVDTPPAGMVSDAIPLMTHVEGVIVVGRVGGNTRDAAHRLRDQLRNLSAPTLGVVANFTESVEGYGYGYGESQKGRAKHTVASP